MNTNNLILFIIFCFAFFNTQLIEANNLENHQFENKIDSSTALKLDIKVEIDTRNYKNLKFTIFKDDLPYKEEIKSNPFYTLLLESNHLFRIRVSAPTLIPKEILVETHGITPNINKKPYTYFVDIELSLKQSKSSPATLLNVPVGKIYFDKGKNNFVSSRKFNKEVLEEFEKLSEETKQKLLEAAQERVSSLQTIENLKKKEIENLIELKKYQEQRANELERMQQIERDQFLNQKKLNEAEINAQKALAMSRQRELEIAMQEKRNKQLEIENATYIKNAFMGITVFIVIVGLLLLRAYFLKRESNAKLHKQNELIAQQKQEITDSIQYAQRIQFAILPTQESIKKVFPESFILFKPKDIVSGDFYWFQEFGEKKYIAVCDCTGHGVPGALMSMIATDMLNDALVNTKHVDEILTHTNRRIKNALKQSHDGESTRDGMDIALCCFDLQANILQYAGAYRPLWMFRQVASDPAYLTNPINSSLSSAQNDVNISKKMAHEPNYHMDFIEIKATKAAIGGLTEESQIFQKNEIKLQKGDTIYLTTDGFADQFNPADKKLMTKRFKEILLSIQNLSLPEQEKYLTQFIADWKKDTEQTDDILVIGVRV